MLSDNRRRKRQKPVNLENKSVFGALKHIYKPFVRPLYPLLQNYRKFRTTATRFIPKLGEYLPRFKQQQSMRFKRRKYNAYSARRRIGDRLLAQKNMLSGHKKLHFSRYRPPGGFKVQRPLGNYKIIKFKSYQSRTYHAASGTDTRLGSIILNSLADPFNTGALPNVAAGNQPFMFDNMKTIFTKYRVHEFFVRFNLTNLSTHSLKFVGLPSSDGTPPTTFAYMAAGPMATIVHVGPGETRTFFTKGSISNIAGENIRNVTSYAAAINQNPTICVLYYWALETFDSTTTDAVSPQLTECHLTVEFWQKARMYCKEWAEDALA